LVFALVVAMIFEQAAIPMSAEAVSSLQVAQSSARAGAARASSRREARTARHGMENLSDNRPAP
jgi:hypothetical protein